MSISDKLSVFKNSEAYTKESPHAKRMILLSEKIYGRRKDLHLSQTELAKRAGTTQRIISQLEDASYSPSKGIGEEMFDKLSSALKIDREYLVSDKIERKTFEIFAYLSEKLGNNLDIMQYMKLPYFIDLEAVKKIGNQLTGFEYIRWNYGPFDKTVYSYKELFEGEEYKIEYSYISDFFEVIDSALENIPVNNGEKLKKLSYETEPMKKLGATLGGGEYMGEKLYL